VLPLEGVALADTVVEVVAQDNTFEDDADTVGMVLSEVTVALAVEVQPLLWVTVTVYVPAVPVVKLDVVCPPGLHR
jgi:hypothetical protein